MNRPRFLSNLPQRTGGLAAGAGATAIVGLVVATTSVPASSGCTTHQCDGVFMCVYPDAKTASEYPCSNGAPSVVLPDLQPVRHEGDVLVWDTASLLGPWLDYGPNTTLSIFYPDEMAKAMQYPVSLLASVSVDPVGVNNARNFVTASGQVAQFTYLDTHAFNVFNGTCAPYQLQVEVRMPVGAGGIDGGDAAIADGGEPDGAIADGALSDALPLDAQADAPPADAQTDALADGAVP